MQIKVKKILSVIWAVILGIIFFKWIKTPFTHQASKEKIEKEAEKKRDKTYEKIKETAPDELLAAADNNTELRGDIDKIRDKSRKRLRDSVGKIVSGMDDNKNN